MAQIALRAPLIRLREKAVLAALLLGWLAVCAIELSRELANPGIRSVVICALAVLAPILILNVARLPIYLFAAYAILVPFNDLLYTGSGPGPTLTRFLAMLTAGCLLLSMLLTGRIAKPSRAFFVLLVLTPYLGATIFWAIDPSTALRAFGVYLSHVGLYAVIALYPFSLRDMKVLLAATLLGALIESAYGDFLFWHGQQVSGSRLFIGVTAQHAIDPNAFAAGLLPPIALAMMLFLRQRFGLAKVGWFAAVAILTGAFLISGSRGGAIGFAVMTVFLMWRSRHRVSLIAIGLLSAVVMIGSPIGQRFMQSDVTSGDGRFDVWKVGFAALRHLWLTGAGIGNFNNAFTQYYFAAPHMWLSWDRVAHSIFMQAAVEYGLAGFILAMAMWYSQFRELADLRVEGAFADICSALRAGVLGLFVAGFSLDLMSYKYTWLLFSLIAVTRTALRSAGVPTTAKPAADRTPPDTRNAVMPLTRPAPGSAH